MLTQGFSWLGSSSTEGSLKPAGEQWLSYTGCNWEANERSSTLAQLQTSKAIRVLPSVWSRKHSLITNGLSDTSVIFSVIQIKTQTNSEFPELSPLLLLGRISAHGSASAGGKAPLSLHLSHSFEMCLCPRSSGWVVHSLLRYPPVWQSLSLSLLISCSLDPKIGFTSKFSTCSYMNFSTLFF